MSQSSKLISRIGTCRSGTKFDVPHELQSHEISAIWDQLHTNDKIDVFCMVEARIARIVKSAIQGVDAESVRAWNHYIWENNLISELKPHLETLGLYTSPSYVQFGHRMLLV